MDINNKNMQQTLLYRQFSFKFCANHNKFKMFSGLNIIYGSVTYRFCPRETSYGRSSGDPLPPRLRNVTNFFSIIYLASLSVVQKSIKYTWGKART